MKVIWVPVSSQNRRKKISQFYRVVCSATEGLLPDKEQEEAAEAAAKVRNRDLFAERRKRWEG